MTYSSSSIIDNRDENTLLVGLRKMSEGGREICVATAFFSLDALLLLADVLADYQRVRILFGDDSDAKQRAKLLQMLRLRSDDDLLRQREELPQLSPLKKVEALFAAGRVEARCYTAKKFHAKAYLITRPVFPSQVGVIGSGNFTRPGLLQ
jgi:HKD family nuclease